MLFNLLIMPLLNLLIMPLLNPLIMPLLNPLIMPLLNLFPKKRDMTQYIIPMTTGHTGSITDKESFYIFLTWKTDFMKLLMMVHFTKKTQTVLGNITPNTHYK